MTWSGGPRFLCLLLWILMMNTHSVISKCGAGQYRTLSNGCQPCPDGEYKTDEGPGHCTVCNQCFEGSKEVSPCERHQNRQCQCLEGFTPRIKRESRCDCGIGYGVDATVPTEIKCVKCQDGYFNKDEDGTSPCHKWTDCELLGVRRKGNDTSDVICNAAPPALMDLNTQRIPVAATAASLNHSITTKSSPTQSPIRNSAPPKSTSAPNPHSGLAGLAGLGTAFSLVLIACLVLIFKLSFDLCLKRFKKQIVQKDSLCRKPVEESGDKSSSSLVSSTESDSQTLEDV